MSNVTITRNDLEQPDYVPKPETNPTGYDDGRASRTSDRPRRRMPFGAFLSVALVAGLLGAFVCVQLAAWVRSEYQDNATFSVLVQACLYLVTLALGVSGAVCALSLALAAFGKATKAGVLEVPGGLAVHSGDVLAGWKRPTVAALASDTMQQHFGVQQTLAQQSTYRNVTAYSPSISTHYSYSGKPDAAQAGQEGGNTPPALPSGPVPPFEALLDSGMIGLDADGHDRMVLGYDADTGEPLTGDTKSLYSLGIGGLQGSGKTWTGSFILAQTALNAGKLIIGDPHAGDKESLANRIAPLAPAFLCDIAESDKDILAALRYAESILKARKHGDPDRTPVIVAIDEWGALRRGELADLLPSFIESFSTEGRKLGCNVLLLSQRWDKNAVGDFRNTLTSQYVHRLRTDEARMLTGFRAASFPVDTLQLAPGTAYLVTTRGAISRVVIPEMSDATMRLVGERLTMITTTPTANSRRTMGFQRPNDSHEIAIGSSEDSHSTMPDYAAVGSAKRDASPLTAEQARIIDLFLSGKDAGAIVTELTGWNSKAGPKYMAKLAEVQAVIRAALKG